jgi:hypothetical protein
MRATLLCCTACVLLLVTCRCLSAVPAGILSAVSAGILLVTCPFLDALPAGIELVLNTRVASVSEGRVTVVDKEGSSFHIPFGACVWSTGIAMNPLAQQLKELFPEQQTHAR